MSLKKNINKALIFVLSAWLSMSDEIHLGIMNYYVCEFIKPKKKKNL